MLSQLITIIVTALLSSLFTITIGYILFQKHLKQRVDRYIDKTWAKTRDELGVIIANRVKEGFLDGVTNIPSREVIRNTTRTMAKAGADILEETLSPLIGKSRTQNRSDDKNTRNK